VIRGEHLDGFGQPCNCTNAYPDVDKPGNGSGESRTPKYARLRGSTLLNNCVWLEDERRAAERWEREKERKS